MEKDRGQGIKLHPAIKARDPVKVVCLSARDPAGFQFGSSLQAKYRQFTMRITAGQMVFPRTAKEQIPAVTKIVHEHTDRSVIDIRAAAELKVEVMKELIEQLECRESFRPTYQEMVFYRTLLDGSVYVPPGREQAETRCWGETLQQTLLKLLSTAYFSSRGDKRVRLFQWLSRQGNTLGLPLPDGEEMYTDVDYETRRFEQEVLLYMRRQQELTEQSEQRSQYFYTQELYYLKKEAVQRREELEWESTRVRQENVFQDRQRLERLSEEVYGRLEKQMDNERKRRGL